MRAMMLNALAACLVLLPLQGCDGTRDGADHSVGVVDDLDGDGYPNEAERSFVSLFSANLDQIEADYVKAIEDPEIPLRYLSLLPAAVGNPGGEIPSINAIPRATVSVVVEGNGTMYPGPGNHEFALYRIHDDQTWSYNTLQFKPVPAPGWRLDEDAWLPPRSSAFELTLEPYLQDVVVAIFAEGVPEFQVSPTDAIGRFVSKYFPESDKLSLDRNGVDTVRVGENFETVLVSNGLPDIAEAAVLERVLKSPDFDRDKRPEYYYDDWRSTWLANLEQARKDYAGKAELPDWASDVIAVYTTMGPDREAVGLLLKETLGVTVVWSNYETKLHRCLGPEGSVANTGSWPIKYWKELSTGQVVSEDLIERFAEKVVTE